MVSGHHNLNIFVLEKNMNRQNYPFLKIYYTFQYFFFGGTKLRISRSLFFIFIGQIMIFSANIKTLNNTIHIFHMYNPIT